MQQDGQANAETSCDDQLKVSLIDWQHLKTCVFNSLPALSLKVRTHGAEWFEKGFYWLPFDVHRGPLLCSPTTVIILVSDLKWAAWRLIDLNHWLRGKDIILGEPKLWGTCCVHLWKLTDAGNFPKIKALPRGMSGTGLTAHVLPSIEPKAIYILCSGSSDSLIPVALYRIWQDSKKDVTPDLEPKPPFLCTLLPKTGGCFIHTMPPATSYLHDLPKSPCGSFINLC